VSRIGKSISGAGKWVGGWLTKYVGWLLITSFVTLSGATALMLFKDWTIKSLFTSMMAWPALGLAMLVAAPIALLPVGRIYLLSAVGGGLLYNLVLLIS
jgi:hypothetical protein